MRFATGAFVMLFAVTMVVVSSRAYAGSPTLKPGSWRLMLTSTTNGKPDPPQDFTQCLSEELQDLNGYFAPQLEGVEAECTCTQQPSKDRTVAYRMQCRGANFTTDALTSVTNMGSRHFTVTMRIETRTPDESAVVVAKGEGRRIGVCPGQ